MKAKDAIEKPCIQSGELILENNSISISFNRTISAYTIVIENDSLEKCLVTLRELYKEFPQYNNVENEIEFSY